MNSNRSVSLGYYLQKVSEKSENFLLPILMFFAPIRGILITVGAFILFDTITGIWKSKKNRVPVTSRGLSAIVSKMLLYQGSILLSFLIDAFILGDFLYNIFSIENLIVKVMALVLIYIEVKSINENYEAVRGINLWKEFKNLISRTKEIKNDITDLTSDEQN